MSKITLEPNSSGAGTFSIVSPDSNTNRTLDLPDEAGKLISTGNDDPAEVFKQSNILGTVSESGGVPTGAIIERGSNSNGEFVKYADGTLICLREVTVITNTTNRQEFTSPATFASSVIASSISLRGGSDAATSRYQDVSEIGLGFTHNASPQGWQLAKATNNTSDGSQTVNLLAIGRWF